AFAITTILMLWSVSIKAASLLGDHSEQGKIMGWMEGLRGVGVMSLAVFTMWVFSRFAQNPQQDVNHTIDDNDRFQAGAVIRCKARKDPHGKHRQLSDRNVWHVAGGGE
ncbi:hypothetical protein ACUOA5_49700, partial [Escherichia coli]